METGQIITGCITGLTAVILGIYASFTVRGRGPILSNTYLWLSKDKRKKADKKKEYKLVSIIYGCLSIIFALLTLNIFTSWSWTGILMWILLAFVIIYAAMDAVKTGCGK